MVSSWWHNTQSAALNLQLSSICSDQQWNISHSSKMMGANQGFLAVLCPCAALGAKTCIFLLDIFGGRTVGRSGCLSTKEGLITARLCALCSIESSEGGNWTWVGDQGYMCVFFAFCFFSCLQDFTMEHLCEPEACVLTSSKHVLPHSGKPLSCVLRWQAGPEQMVSSMFHLVCVSWSDIDLI